MDAATGSGTLPARRGPRPRTFNGLPHHQIDQQPADPGVREELARRAFGLGGVREASSSISVPGARALVLDESQALGPSSAYLTEREFAHFHPEPDWSLHAALPEARAREAVEAGWAEFHVLVSEGRLPPTVVMLYAPRDHEELEVTWGLLQDSYRFALGEP